MKKAILMVMTATLLSTGAHAALTYVGKDSTAGFDASGFPADMKTTYKLMQTKCNNPKCHTMQYVQDAIRTGNAPISKGPFDKAAAKAYGVKMMRRPDSGIDKGEAKSIVELLYFLLDEKLK